MKRCSTNQHDRTVPALLHPCSQVAIEAFDLALRLRAIWLTQSRRPCRDAGVGEIALGLAMLKRANRASHIDPPASSNAIMRRARPYRGENPEPGKDVTESLTPRPELENQDPFETLLSRSIAFAFIRNPATFSVLGASSRA